MDAVAISVLSRLTFGIFQPAFLIDSIASTLCSTAISTGAGGSGGMPRQLLGFSFLPSAFQLMITCMAGRQGHCPSEWRVSETTKREMCNCGSLFQNCRPLPLVFADALFSGSLLADVTAYISFYLFLACWSPLFWRSAVGRMIVRTYGESSDATVVYLGMAYLPSGLLVLAGNLFVKKERRAFN